MAYLLPPPDRNYPSFETLYRDIQAHAKAQGYCLNAQAKHKDIRYEVKCDKAGKYISRANPGPNTKNKTSKKTNCPMRCSAVYDIHEGCWKFKVVDPRHNHLPSDSPAEHTRHRQDEREQQRGIIEEGLQRGDSGPVIYQAILDQFPDTITSLRDIDNSIQAIKKARREDPESLGPRQRRLIGPVIPEGLGKKVPKKPWLPELRRMKETIRERDKRLEALEREKEEFQLRITRLEQVLYRQQPPPASLPPPHLQPPPMAHQMPPPFTYQAPPPPQPPQHQSPVQNSPNTPSVPSSTPAPNMNFKVITPTTWKT